MKNYISTIIYAYIFIFLFTIKIVSQNCTNMDFETGDLTGWTDLSNGTGNSCYVVTPGNDINFPTISKVYSGNYSACIDATQFLAAGGGKGELSQTFSVTSLNSNFVFHAAFYLYGRGHRCSRNPKFSISVTSGGVTLPCSSLELTAFGTGGDECSSFPGFQESARISYLNWTPFVVPLENYIGSNVTISIKIENCDDGPHGGKAYFEGSCGSVSITTTCSGNGISLGVPNFPGYNYDWVGPNGFTANV